MLQNLLRASKRIGSLLLKSFVMISAVRAQNNPPNKVLTCNEYATPEFAALAQQVFLHSLPNVCDESLPLLGTFTDSNPSLLKKFTLAKLTTGTFSTYDFETGEQQHSNTFMTQLDSDGNSQAFQFDANGNRRMFVANIEGKQGENCGVLMNLECVIKEDEQPQPQTVLKSARI